MVALVNRGKKSHKITVKWSDLGLSNDENGNIYDVWGQAKIGSAKGSYTSEVASHGTTLIRVDV